MMMRFGPYAVSAAVRLIPILVDSGAAPGALELRTGTGELLARLSLPRPAAPEVGDDGTIVFHSIKEAVATGSGQAAVLHLRDGDDHLILEADIGDLSSNAFLKMEHGALITAGAPITIRSFELMP